MTTNHENQDGDPHQGEDSSINTRDQIADEMACQIRRQGYYVTYVLPQRHQALTDLRWAAQLAGRLLSRRTTTYASAVGLQHPGMITLVVAPTDGPPVRLRQSR
jgi:hypothetical protein